MSRVRVARPFRFILLNTMPRSDLETLAATFGVNGKAMRDRIDITNAVMALPDQAIVARALSRVISRLLKDEVE